MWGFHVDYLFAAKSLGLLLASRSWWRVWHTPDDRRIRAAAFWTALCLILESFRLALALVLGAA
jgi:hypothetical protein